MHRDICFICEQRIFQFLDEQPFAADFCQRHIQDLVSAAHQRHQLHHQAGMMTFQFSFHILRLPEGEQTFTGGDA
jgi:hypothetical protein